MYLFPSIGLGTLLSGARHITDGMLQAAAECLASYMTKEDIQKGILYPSIDREMTSKSKAKKVTLDKYLAECQDIRQEISMQISNRSLTSPVGSSTLVSSPSPLRSVRPPSPSSNKFSPLTYSQATTAPQTKKSPFLDNKPTTEECKYHKKGLFEPIMTVELGYYSPNSTPREIIQNMLPKDFHFIPKDTLKKNRLFYELILVDTKSISLDHYYSTTNPNYIDFSKAKILKVLSPKDWAQALHTPKTFSIKFDPPSYTYWDYQDAWYKFLLIRPYNHSWFFWFNKGISNIPSWFIDWVRSTGPCLDILPAAAKNAYDNFVSATNFPSGTRLVHFYIAFGIA